MIPVTAKLFVHGTPRTLRKFAKLFLKATEHLDHTADEKGDTFVDPALHRLARDVCMTMFMHLSTLAIKSEGGEFQLTLDFEPEAETRDQTTPLGRALADYQSLIESEAEERGARPDRSPPALARPDADTIRKAGEQTKAAIREAGERAKEAINALFEPPTADTIETRGDRIRDALRRALHPFDPARLKNVAKLSTERWEQRRRTGLDDAQLQAAIAEEFRRWGKPQMEEQEFYVAGGSGFPAIWIAHPSLNFNAEEASRVARADIKDAELVALAREILDMPGPKEIEPTAPAKPRRRREKTTTRAPQ